MKTVYFVARPPRAVRSSDIVDLTETADDPGVVNPSYRYISPAPLYAANSTEWRRLFIDWMGSINCANASLEWWAYTASAKNFLSSPLGNELFQSLALLHIITVEKSDSLYIIGARRSQIEFLRHRLDGNPSLRLVASRSFVQPLRDRLVFAMRLAFHAGKIWFSSLARPRELKEPAPGPDICMFTYFDPKSEDYADAYFGELGALIATKNPACSIIYTGFVHGKLNPTLSRLAGISSRQCWPLFLEARLSDLLWAFARSIAALNLNRYALANALEGAEALKPLLKSALLRDVINGGFFYGLVVYRSAIRFGKKFRPAHLIYPFENKSIEKMLLLGLRQSCPTIRLTGYQHTSITPRHTTFLLAPGEASVTPLPDRIVTVGTITRTFLEENGNYPAGIFQTGCALRQTWNDLPPPNPDRTRKPRILLALSSSTSELIRSVFFFRTLCGTGGNFELGIRPHPEFPLSRLPKALAEWASRNARDFSGTKLADNIEWCDLTAYVSSTVALETLMAGKPAVNFSVGDVLQPDPVIGNAPLCWRVENPRDFLRVLNEVNSMSAPDFQRASAAARAYVHDYLRPVSDACIAGFLDPQSG